MISEVRLMKSLEHTEEEFKEEHMDAINKMINAPYTGGVLSAIYIFKQLIEESPKIDVLGAILKAFDVRTQYELPDDARTAYRIVEEVIKNG